MFPQLIIYITNGLINEHIRGIRSSIPINAPAYQTYIHTSALPYCCSTSWAIDEAWVSDCNDSSVASIFSSLMTHKWPSACTSSTSLSNPSLSLSNTWKQTEKRQNEQICTLKTGQGWNMGVCYSILPIAIEISYNHYY